MLLGDLIFTTASELVVSEPGPVYQHCLETWLKVLLSDVPGSEDSELRAQSPLSSSVVLEDALVSNLLF